MTFFNFTDSWKKIHIKKSFSDNKIIKNRSIYWYLNDISFIIWIAKAQLKIIRRIKKIKAFFCIEIAYTFEISSLATRVSVKLVKI